jgi:cation diffusion facilitator CzcD-associated flavoprotein CzcO
VENFELKKLMSFNSKVLSAKWNDEDGLWHFVVDKDGEIIHDTAHVFFNGSGFTTDWTWPDIRGIENYKGKLIHPAQWDMSYDYTGKKVALLGNGSTAIQILPAIRPDVEHLTTFIRSPTWITPGFGAEHAPTGDGANFKYSEEQHELWKKDPNEYFAYRKQLD